MSGRQYLIAVIGSVAVLSLLMFQWSAAEVSKDLSGMARVNMEAATRRAREADDKVLDMATTFRAHEARMKAELHKSQATVKSLEATINGLRQITVMCWASNGAMWLPTGSHECLLRHALPVRQ